MTAARPQRKRRRIFGPILALFGALIGLFGPYPAFAATTERVVTDRHTGLAISGFDPVAYFVDAVPKAGRPEIELPFAGATWLFRNEGNRAAFADRPDIYMPRYGGYDPVAVARGVARAGHPDYWLVVEDRLYLFANAQTRDSFAAAPDQAVAAAETRWPEVYAALSP
jgi:hypothetical protein